MKQSNNLFSVLIRLPNEQEQLSILEYYVLQQNSTSEKAIFVTSFKKDDETVTKIKLILDVNVPSLANFNVINLVDKRFTRTQLYQLEKAILDEITRQSNQPVQKPKLGEVLKAKASRFAASLKFWRETEQVNTLSDVNSIVVESLVKETFAKLKPRY